MKRLIIVELAFVLVACGAVAPLPEDVYLRLAVAVPVSGAGKPWTAGDLRVAPFVASGLYKERALAYTRDGGHSLQQSHYELWIDSPEHMLQQEIAAYLRGTLQGAQIVTDSTVKAHFVVTGRITHFEQLAQAGSNIMMAGLELSIRDLRRQDTPFVKAYIASEPMDDATPTAVAQAMSRAVAAIYAAFVVDVSNTFKPLLARESAP